jgi:asparagine synthase (glutamine-hydrolysing)
MLNSIEMRSPFLDYRIVQLGLSLPVHFKMNNGISKFILRQSFREIVPNEIIEASWKLGYAVPKQSILESGPRTNLERNQNEYWRTMNLNSFKQKI